MALDARKRRAVELLASGKTQAETGRELGCDRATVCRWMQDVEFAAEVDAAQREMTKAFHRDMRTQAVRVSERWSELINSPDDGVALRALLAWVEKFGGLEHTAQAAADPVDTERVLAFMRWEQEQSSKQGNGPRSDDGSDSPGTSD